MDETETHDGDATERGVAAERADDGQRTNGNGEYPPDRNGDSVHATRTTRRGVHTTRRGVLTAVAGIGAVAALGGVVGGSRTAGSSLRNGSTVATHGDVAKPGADWRFDAGAGANAAAAFDPPRTLGKAWRQGFTNEVLSIPFVPRDTASNRIYLIGSQRLQSTTVYAVDRDSGSVAWSQDTGFTAPTPAWKPNETLYIGKGALGMGGSVELVARAADDGSVQWRNASSFGSNTRVQPVHVPADSTVYAVTRGPTVVALDEATGDEQWRVDVGRRGVPVVAATGGAGSKLFVTSNPLTTGGSDGLVTAVDRAAGTELWTNDQIFPVGSNLQVVNGTVYSGFTGQTTGNSDLVAIDASSGTVQWSKSRTDGLGWAFLLSHANGVYAQAVANRNGTTDGEMVKFDGGGNRQWSYDAGGMFVGTQIGSDVVHVATRDGRVAEVTDPATGGGGGTESWSTSLNAGIRDAALRRAGDVLYTGTISQPGRVYALDANGGSTVDTYDLSGGVTGGMAVYNDRIWVVGRPPYSTTSGDSALYELGDGDADDGSGNGNGNGNGTGNGSQHESGVPQNVFDAVAGPDGTLERQDVLELVRAYATGDTVGGVSVTREHVLALVRYYVT